MKEIRISYRTLGIRRTIRRTVPTLWGELSEQQFLAAVGALHGNLSEAEYLHIMTTIPRRHLRKLDSWATYLLQKLVDGLRSKQSLTSRFFIDHVGTLQAPAPALADMSLLQFMTVDEFWFQADAQEPDTAKLARFVGALYLKPGQGYFSDDEGVQELVDFGENACEAIKTKGILHLLNIKKHQAKRIATLKAIAVNWAMIRLWLAKVYPLLFQAPEQKENAQPSTLNAQRQTPKSPNWVKIFDAFVGDDIAHIDAYKHLPCMDAFRIINNRIRQNLTRKK